MHVNFPFHWHEQPPFKGRGLTVITSIKSMKMLIHCCSNEVREHVDRERTFCDSYVIVIPRVLASGLSYIQMDKNGIAILYHLHQCGLCTSRDSSCLSWCGIKSNSGA